MGGGAAAGVVVEAEASPLRNTPLNTDFRRPGLLGSCGSFGGGRSSGGSLSGGGPTDDCTGARVSGKQGY